METASTPAEIRQTMIEHKAMHRQSMKMLLDQTPEDGICLDVFGLRIAYLQKKNGKWRTLRAKTLENQDNLTDEIVKLGKGINDYARSRVA